MIKSNRTVAIISGIIVLLSFTDLIAFQQVDTSKEPTWEEMLDSSEYYEQLPNYESAIIWGEKAFESAKKQFGEIDTNVAFCAGTLSHLYDTKGEIQKVLYYARLDSAIWEQKLGKECQGYVNALSFLANQYNKLSDFPLAEKYNKECIEISRRLFKGDNSSFAGRINSLALFYKRQGRYKEAEPLYIESLEMARRIYTSDNEYLAMYIDNMAQFYRATGNINKASELTLEALAMYRRLYPGDNHDLAVSINNAAFFYEDLGKNDEAEKLFTESLEMRKRLFKGDNPDIALQLHNMAGFYEEINKYDKADSLYKLSIEIQRRLNDNDNPQLAKTLSQYAGLCLDQNRFLEADSLNMLSYEMTKRIYKGDHPDLATVMNNRATIYFSIGKYEEGQLLLKESLEMKKRLYKSDHPDIAASLYSFGAILLDKGKYDEAESLFKESGEMFNRLYKGDNSYLLLIMGTLSRLNFEKGKYIDAEKLMVETMEMAKRIYKGDHGYIANAINNLAMLYKVEGRFSETEKMLLESLNMRKRIYKGDHSDIALVYFNLGKLYQTLGNFIESEKYFKDGLSMTQRLFKDDNKEKARFLNALAELYDNMGRYSDEEHLLKDALEMRKRLFGLTHNDISETLNSIGRLYHTQGKYRHAEETFKKAIEIDRGLGEYGYSSLHSLLNNLAALYIDLERLEEAEILLKESIDIKKKIYKDNNPDLAIGLEHMATIYKKLGKYTECESLLKEALEMKRSLFKEENFTIAANLNNLAGYYRDMDRLAEAEPLQKESLEIMKKIYKSDNLHTALCLHNLGYLYQAEGKLVEAEPTFIESLDMFKRIFNAQSTNLSEKEKESYWATMDAKFEFLYSFVLLRMNENPAITGYAFDNLLYTKALLFNVSNKIKKRIMESGDSVLIAKYKEFTDKKELIIKLYSLTKNEVAQQGYNIDSLETIANNLEKELSYKSEAFKQSYEKKKVSWRSIQTLLKPDEAAIEMVRFRHCNKNKFTDTVYYAAMIITDQTTENPEFVLLENGNELEEKYFTQYRNSVKLKSYDNESFKNFWQKIYDKTKDYKKIYFSPDGVYNKLNIGTFLIDSGKYLLDLQKIHQLNSVQELLLGYFSKQDETNVYNSALLIGNPDFSLSQDKVLEKERSFQQEREVEERGFVPSRSMSLSPLPGTEKEVDNIAKYLKSKKWVVNMFTKSDAVKASIKAANNPRVLHLATHGLFLSDIKPDEKEIFGMETERIIGNPLLRSGLFFAGASSTIEENFRPTGYDNGFLSAYEAMNLNLDKTELVVLSACETGLGEIKNGEGVYGLQRAFIQAGAKSVIMSLWSVSDDATQELMSSFYKEWLGGKTKREAFRIAQMKLKEKYTYPYYWGAFVMVGE